MALSRVATLILLLSTGCATPGTPSRGHVRVAVSVDWEGSHLQEKNLDAMVRFHRVHPGVPLTQLLNAAYYTRPGTNPQEVTAKIRTAIAPEDETGLHVHCWKTLVDAAGIPFRHEPTFWGRPTRPYKPSNDSGYDVELEAYEPAEVEALLRKARAILTEAGFEISGSFRAGGWAAGPRAREGIRAAGFDVDTSCVDTQWHDEWKDVPLKGRLRELWPEASPTQAPYVIDTAAGPLLEMPDTGALADYLTAAEMEAHIRDAVRRLASDPTRDVFIHIGFHQDSAARYIDRVIEAISAIRSDPALPVIFETLQASARAHRAK